MFKRLALIAATALLPMLPANAQSTDTAIVAGGCFWCVEGDFRKVKGVTDVRVGYTGGTEVDPVYEDVARGRTGHIEAAAITFDTSVISYAQIMDLFLRSIDVFDAGGQFCDRGFQYSTAIFAQTPAQRATAEAAITAAQAQLGRQIVTPVRDAMTFYDAEEYHQNYPNKDSRVLTRFGWITKADAYARYRTGCGRDARLRAIWGSDTPFAS